MKSQIVNIGGYDWQIKFYPKGNDSDYLSIYVECLNVTTKEEKKYGQVSSHMNENMMRWNLKNQTL